MKKHIITAATVALTFAFATSACAELLHVEIKTLGMD
jgi:hypothetical protein